jgi:hypothetical protein
MAEETKYHAGVELTIRDGRYYFNILAQEGLDIDAVRSILVGGLSLTILSEKTPEKQGQALRAVINYLESELVNIDSFTDIGGPLVPKK